MSTHTTSDTRHESPVQTTIEPGTSSDAAADDTPTRTPSADASSAPAMFDTGSLLRLPNTVDDENQYVG